MQPENVTCQCCDAAVPTVNDDDVCFSCDVYMGIDELVEAHLSEEHATAMAIDVHEWVMSRLLERLNQHAQEHPLTKELQQTMVPVAPISPTRRSSRTSC